MKPRKEVIYLYQYEEKLKNEVIKSEEFIVKESWR